MGTYFSIAQIVVAVALMLVILLQVKGGGLGGIFGQAETVYRTKRGVEKTLFQLTIALSINELCWRNDITLTTSYAASPADYQAALDLISGRNLPVTKLITHRLGLAETKRGFQLVCEAKDSIKVIIEPQNKLT